MTDYFALLEMPRRPWLDPDSLKEKFLALSAKFHPDRLVGGDEVEKRVAHERYIELNAAYNSLKNPKDRLSHLIRLEQGASASDLQTVPATLMNVFMEVGELCKMTDRFLSEKAAATSPLLKVQLFERGQELSDQLAALQARLGVAREELAKALKTLDEQWPRSWDEERRALLGKLEEIRRLFGFFDRWISQVQERFVQLAL